MSYVFNNIHTTTAIVKIKSQDGKISGELVAASPRIANLTLKSVTQDGKTLKVTLTNGNLDFVYEANLPAKTPTKLTGSYAQGTALLPATLTLTNEMQLEAKDLSQPVECPPAQRGGAR